jgi:ABC-type maltose transport system permease subunit
MSGKFYSRRGFIGPTAAAGILIAVVPILIAYIVLQKWIVGGLTAGATKG